MIAVGKNRLALLQFRNNHGPVNLAVRNNIQPVHPSYNWNFEYLPS
jgi:hypothetical protein